MEVRPDEFLTYLEWLLPGKHHPGDLKIGAFTLFLMISAVLLVLGTFIGYLLAALRHGPGEGFYVVARTYAAAVVDAASLSLRRVLAVAFLAIQEAIRRKVLVGVGIFMVLLLFAGWFLDTQNDNPARLYLSFLLTSTNYLVLALALFLSTFSIPNDIKHRTIFTVVTKPVRAGELILGRMLGFITIGTFLVALMCLAGYLFVTQGLKHAHVVDPDRIEAVTGADGQVVGWKGRTNESLRHFHNFELELREQEDGSLVALGETEMALGHSHAVEIDVIAGDPKAADKKLRAPQLDLKSARIGAAKGMLTARIPRYGVLRFLDRAGRPGRGIDVGEEWQYKGYVEGGSRSAAIWNFRGVNKASFPNGLNIDKNIQVFRTYKGDIVSGIRGSMILRHPDETKGRRSEPFLFTAKEFQIDEQFIPEDLVIVERDGKSRDGNLFEDLVDENGRLELEIQCLESGQYFGVSQADVYLRAKNGLFFINFIKGYISIWLQMVLVTCFGVMYSTFVSGPVAMIATLSTVILGYFGNWLRDISYNPDLGGGPIESLIRTVLQSSIAAPFEDTLANSIIRGVDQVVLFILRLLCEVLPNYSNFDTSERIAYGFDVDVHLLSRHLTLALVYVAGTTIIGYFFLKTREIASAD